MSLVDLVMPKLGESIMEATILKWHKNPGDAIRQDEAVLDIATDKVDSEVPSTAEGTLEEVLFQANDVVPVGAVIARIRTSVGISQPAMIQPPVSSGISSTENAEKEAAQEIPYQPVASGHSLRNSAARFYSPLVLNIAASEGVSMSELETMPGTGNEGRVTKKDILEYVAKRGSGSVSNKPAAAPAVASTVQILNESSPSPVILAPATTAAKATEQFPSIAVSGNVEIIEMDRMRKLIADHMVKSKATSPHVTSFSEADVTNMVLWREKIKNDFEKREGEKITFTPLFIEAIVRCLKKYPWLNASVDGNRIVVKKDINIGMATALPNGNLIVPVIKGADQLNLVGMTRQVNKLAQAARSNQLRPDDTQGGSFTFTNVGTFGSLMGTPIINQPQVAILATGAIKKRPVVVETALGDSIAIRHMMYISMSYDHRIIDGSLGATFVTAFAHELENFDPERNI